MMPKPPHKATEALWQQCLANARSQGISLDEKLALTQSLHEVWRYSPFVAQSCLRYPAMLAALWADNLLQRPYAAGEMQRYTAQACHDCGAQTALEAALRHNRRKQMVRIAWRDLAGQADVVETLEDLSALADASLQQAMQHLYPWACQNWGTPRDSAGQAQTLVILGMGKLGARELNFSSDIDLIFGFAKEGQTDSASPIDNTQFFTRLCHQLIRVIDSPLPTGFVFRVDTRLRPYGDSGPLVMSFAAMEEYYQEQARDWERYAMIKARPIASDSASGQALMAMLQPFIYRRYLDYGTFQSLREMKQAIAQALQGKKATDNIKLGIGGIREIEFIGQAFQLIRGGREAALQTRSILKVLTQLGTKGYLPAQAVTELQQAYLYLRRVENHLQAYADQQTHSLPTDPEMRLCLSLSMGQADWPSFVSQLTHHRNKVQAHFEEVFANESATPPSLFSPLCSGQLDPEQALLLLAAHGFEAPNEALQRLTGLRNTSAYRRLTARGQDRLDQFLPLLLAELSKSKSGPGCLHHLLDLIEHILQRTAYLALLIENPMALTQLVRLAKASPWIIRLLGRHPILLDELLDPRTLYAPPQRPALQQELQTLLQGIAADDLEKQMESLRYFAQSQQLRIAAADVTGALPIMAVSDYLSELAEVVLDKTLTIAWDQLSHRYGVPNGQFAIIAYGKLGGLELGYGSDLDLVFLHHSEGEDPHTSGPKPIADAVFFSRLGQRILHILTTYTPSGRLYEVDMRLRPSGNAGPLTTSITAFAEYQSNTAWTWEHQALIRARYVAGDPQIGRDFSAVRRRIIAQPRAATQLQKEVREMRERMRTERAGKHPQKFDLKQDAGGIADIEFIVQFGVLRWGHRCLTLLQYCDNIRLLEVFATEQLLPPATCQLLISNYQQLRNAAHHNTLQEQPALAECADWQEQRAAVQAIWLEVLGKS